jgi:two-component system CheB/CheR fusion protein
VKIFATDLDEGALAKARAATYSPEAVENVPEELRERYFVKSDGGFAFRQDLRRTAIFGRNELLQDAPISRIDLLACRNVLMYFTAEAQARILSQLNFALNDRGLLFLGKSEMLVRHSNFFTPVDLKWRLFRRLPRRRLGERLGEMVGDTRASAGASAGAGAGAGSDIPIVERHADLRELAASTGPAARLVIDMSRLLVDSNDLADDLFSIEPGDIGKPIQDVEVSYSPLELRGPLDRALEQGKATQAGRAELGDPGEERIYEAEILPLIGGDGVPAGAVIAFTDVTDYANLAADYGKSKRELESAYEELQSTVEELETTNEVLQSTNEELETTNEELQSANEELQTMNEELTSTNDELEMVNQEQRQHSGELDRLNLFLQGILGSLRFGVTVIDRVGRVQLWNAGAQDLWGLRPEEVDGEDFFSLDIGLPTKDLRKPLEEAVSGNYESTDLLIEAVNRRGSHFTCEVRVLPLASANQDHYGAILLMRAAGDGDSTPV